MNVNIHGQTLSTELNNLASDPAFSETEAELHAALLHWMEEHQDPYLWSI